MAQSSVTLKALGLKLTPNQLELPPGSMSEASNIIIRRDNVVQSRRGYKLYGSSFGSSSDRAKQLISYKNVLIRHYNTILQYETSTVDDNGVTQFSSFSGNYSEPETGVRIKSIESNGNLYFTTSDGIKKLSVVSGSDLSASSVTVAGGLKALELNTQFVYENGNITGYVYEDTAVRYQVLWAIKDANSNLILGTPSPSTVVSNSLRVLLINDLNYVLHAIDNVCLSGGTMNDANYSAVLSLPTTATSTQLRDNINALIAKLNTDGAVGVVATFGAISNPATHNELVSLQSKLSEIINTLLIAQAPAIIPTAYKTEFIDSLAVSTTSNVQLTIPIPTGATTNHFYQVYRSLPQIVSGADSFDSTPINPSTELQLAYEGFIIQDDISNGYVVAMDSTPDTFLGAYLYTNSTTGEGSAQANDPPPLAKDINRYRNTVFYANTKTKQQMTLDLLGIQRIANNSTLTIATATSSQTYTFKTGVIGSLHIAGDTYANTTNKGYITLYSARDKFKRWFWFEKLAVGALNYGVAPSTPVGFTADEGVMVYVGSGTTTAADMLERLRSAINQFSDYWVTGYSGPNLAVTNTTAGKKTTGVATNLGGLWSTGPAPVGEGGLGKDILLSTSVSPATATQETALDLVRAINSNSSEVVYAYYISSATDVPGKMYLIARNLSTTKFYVLGSDSEIGLSFSPDISPNANPITGISLANPTVITTTSDHNLQTTDQIIITKSNSDQSIDGIHTITKLSNTTFSIPVSVATLAGTSAYWEKLSETEAYSSNEEKTNRVYYSKFQQPEAVPLLNYFDVGAQDKAILRIFPLRDSLFVFKEDGLYRISGESSPFALTLFDNTCTLIAPDSLGVANNLVYGYTRQGISVISEAGVSLVSRDIDTDLLKIPTLNRSVFTTATWGVGYESDNSYTVYTIKTAADSRATIAYRYSNLTNTWTTFDKTNTCGLVNPNNDRLYLGAGDTNYLEQERKNFDRTDFSDREFSKSISSGQLSGSTLKMLTVSDVEVGDVIVQSQKLTTYEFNMLLKKLDFDATVALAPISSITTGATPIITTTVSHNIETGDSVTITNSNCSPSLDGSYTATKLSPTTFSVTPSYSITSSGTSGIARYNYYNNLNASAGANLRAKLEALAAKLDSDPGIVNTDYLSSISSFTAVGSTTISSNTAANPTVITVGAAHNLISGRIVTITSSGSTPSIDGTKVVTVLSPTTFSVPTSVTIAGATGTVVSQTDDFRDIEVCYNHIISKLNTDTGPSFNNYTQIDTTTDLEAVILSINNNTKEATLNQALDFVIGSYTVYKAIDASFTYSNITMGDPLNMKQMFESTLMFDSKTFTKATLSFSTDLLPEFKDIPFVGQGNGIFGNNTFGSGFFGGVGSSVPFRTYIPQQCQRCRFLNVKYTHRVAREMPEVYGLTLTGNTGISGRAYR